MLPPPRPGSRPTTGHGRGASRPTSASASTVPSSANGSSQHAGGESSRGGAAPESASNHHHSDTDIYHPTRRPDDRRGSVSGGAGGEHGWGAGGSNGGGGRSDVDLQDRHVQNMADRNERGDPAESSSSRVPMSTRGELVGEEGFSHVVSIERGTLAGKLMRFQLTVEQQPIHARRKTDKDRRPIAHCPILRLRMKEVIALPSADGQGLSAMEEQDVDVNFLEPGHFICAAELYEVNPDSVPSVTDPARGPPQGKRLPHRRSLPDLTQEANPRDQPDEGDHRVTPPGGRDVSMESSPPPEPATAPQRHAPGAKPPPKRSTALASQRPHAGRSTTWVGDHVASLPGVAEANRYPDEYGEDIIASQPLELDSPSTPLPPSLSTSSSNSLTPVASRSRPGIDIQPTFPRPVDSSKASAAAARRSLVASPSSEQSKSDDMPAHLAGTSRTAADRSSESGGSGDTVVAKPAPKRAKPLAQRSLFGCLHVPAVRVVAPDGELALWFLFTDLCVRQEGTFALRFRVFDIASADKEARTSAPVLGEAESQAFKVYSPRNFPGLPKPTELADHFARQGFKLNTRKNERQIKTPPPEDSLPPTTKNRPNPPPRPPSPSPLETKSSAGSVQSSLGYQPSTIGRISTLQHTSSDERSTLVSDTGSSLTSPVESSHAGFGSTTNGRFGGGAKGSSDQVEDREEDMDEDSD